MDDVFCLYDTKGPFTLGLNSNGCSLVWIESLYCIQTLESPNDADALQGCTV